MVGMDPLVKLQIKLRRLSRKPSVRQLDFNGLVTKNFGGVVAHQNKGHGHKIFDPLLVKQKVRSFKPNLKKFKQEAEEVDPGLITSLSGLIETHLSLAKISKLQMVSIVTTLTSLIMNACLLIKYRTKIVIANFALSLVQFLCLIMSFEGFELDDTTNLVQQVEEEFMDLSQRNPEHTKIEYKDSVLKEYLTRLMELPNQKGIFVQIQRQEFPNIVLPPHRLPVFHTESARAIKPFLVFPDWFLATYWNETFDNVQMWRKKCMMVSDRRMNENLSGDDVARSSGEYSSDMSEESESEVEEPVVEENRKPNLMNAKVEFDWDNTSIKNILMRVINAMIYLAECKFGSKNFSVGDLRKSMKYVEEDMKITGEINDLRSLITGKKTDKQIFIDTIKNYGDRMTEYLEKPTFEFAKYPKHMSNCKSLLSEFLEFYTSLSQEGKIISSAVQGIYVALNQKYVSLITTEIQSMSRQEPFVVLFRGAGGIGKTQFVKRLMLDCCKYLGFKPTESIVEITPDDKYWPPLANQELAFFDEAGSKQDFSSDLLFANLKSLCSPTFFNAAAADIPHKINPFTSKIIFATTNTSFDHLATRVTQLFDSNTWGAMCRRMIIFDCAHDSEKFGKLDPNNPHSSNFDSENYRHIINTRYIYNGFKLVRKEGSVRYTKDKILHEIYERYDRLTREHHRAMSSMILENSVQENANNHLSVVIHGRNGQGKSKLCSEIRFKLGNALHMPVYCFEKFSELLNFKPQKRSVVILDDILRATTTLEEENFLMDFFNHILINNSIIIWTTNVSPKFNIFPTVTLNSIYRNMQFTFKNEGLFRRVGYQGYVNDSPLSDMNLEFTIQNFNLYKIIRNNISISEYFFGREGSLLKCLFGIICDIPLLWFRTYGRQEFVPLSNFVQEIYDAYISYLAMRKEICVKYQANLELNGKFHLKLYGKSSRTVLKGSQREVVDNIFVSENLYDEASREWKIYCDKDLSLILQRNPEKFIVQEGVYNEEFIIGIISRYVNALIEMGNEPRLMAQIEDVGIFLYEDGVLYIDRLEEVHNMHLQVVCINDNAFVCVNEKDIPLRDVLVQPNLVYERFHCTMDESAAVSQYVKSSAFLSNKLVVEELKEIYKNDIKIKTANLVLEVNQYFNKFKSSLFGKIILVLLTLISAYALYKIIARFFKSDDSVEEKKAVKKGSPKIKNYDSDDERKVKRQQFLALALEKRNKKKGSPKVKNYESDDDNKTSKKNEDVLTLSDMNTHDSYKPYMEVAHKQARRNLCMVYAHFEDKEEINVEPAAGRLCYGLYVFDNVLVTVGHIRQVKDVTFYAGMDSFEGKFKKMHLVQGYKFRDLSVWYTKNTTFQKDISSLFFSNDTIDLNLSYNCCFQRFSANKIEEYHTSEFSYFEGPDPFEGGQLTKWGSAYYGLFDIKVSNGGDCGLPYYCLEKYNGLRNKIFGIHCMGNVEDTMTSGIMSCIFQEDVVDWKKALIKAKQESGECYYCGFNATCIKPDDYPKCDGHQNVWFMDHTSTFASGIQEIQFFRQRYPGFVGLIIKNSGNMFGTVKHSHTQFLPETVVGQFSDVLPDLHAWREVDLFKIVDNYSGNSKGMSVCVDVPVSKLSSNLSKLKTIGENFRIKIQIFKNPINNDFTARIYVITEIISHLSEVKFENACIAFNSNYGDPVHVNESVGLILTSAMNNLKRGKQEDMPFRTMPNNETVKVIGSFVNTKSHIPASQYVKSPFSQIVEDIIPIEKKPTVFDLNLIPQEEKDLMVKDNYGIPSQLATQSVGWAHKIFGNPVLLRRYGKLFKSKILRYYSDMSLLTDEEVLAGYPKSHKLSACLRGMELDSSIGFTMKELFYVNKKSDVISVDDTGKYSWCSNPAACFLKEMYEECKGIQDKGDKYWSVFTELLKDEKLKISKIYKGRTFTAQDVLGVLMERRALGEFCARAMGNDPNCGVGTDPVKDFQRIYTYLNNHPNIWAGDYKRFDRSIPAIIFQIISELLQECNPKIKNQVKSTFKVIIERLQVVGKTMCEVFGGMPSGCFSTAPLNSLANEFALFCVFCYLCEEAGITPSFKLYEDNIRRIFYGDDVLVSVSNEFKKIFDRANVARCLEQLFGMMMTSSDKGDGMGDYDSYENASWISRYFRQFGEYPMMCGALKKISIGAYFHYVTSNSLEHLGRLMEVALYEASFWEDEYFYIVQSAVRRCIEKDKRLLKFVNLIDLEIFREQIFHSNIGCALNVRRENPDRYRPTEPRQVIDESIPEAKVGQWGITTSALLAEVLKMNDVLEENPNVVEIKEVEEPKKQLQEVNENKTTFFQKYIFKTKYFEKIVRPIMAGQMKSEKMATMCSYISKVNELFQQGKILKPIFEFEQDCDTKVWKCTLFVNPLYYVGRGYKKQEAKEAVCYNFLVAKGHTKELKVKLGPSEFKPELKNFKQEMMMTQGSKVPVAPMVAQDVSVVTDAGLYTNTDAPSPARIYNNTAIALDNPCGSGAPFSKHQQVYSIYQRWEEKNVTINPSLASGSEIFRISLDPKTWPDVIREYVDFHEAIIPAIDVVVAIAGAAGTIGWIISGWVSDASPGQVYSLNDLQQISAETTNMNGTQILKIRLEDVRRQGLFRLTAKDTEPYPGIVFMIDQAVTNVQRNDSVNYPVRVQMRLAPTCVLMRPFNKSGGSTGIEDFDLGSYMYAEEADMLIGSNSITTVAAKTIQKEGHGWDSKTWDGSYDRYSLNQYVFFTNDFYWVMMGDQTDTTKLNQDWVYSQDKTPRHCGPFRSIVISFGKVTELPYYADYKDFTLPLGSVYQIAEVGTHIGGLHYKTDKVYVEENGYHLVLALDFEIMDMVTSTGDKFQCNVCYNTINTFSNQLVKTDTSEKTTTVDYVGWNGKDFSEWRIKVYDKLKGCDGFSPDCDYKFDVTSLKTYIFTGNTMPTTALPTGLKSLQFVRKGTTTTVTTETPFVPLTIPLIEGAMTALDRKMSKFGYEAIKGDLISNGTVIGEIGYSNRCFVVRTDVAMKFRSTTNNLEIRNISGINSDDLAKIQAFNAVGFNSWGSSTLRFKPKFVPNLFNCRQEVSAAMDILPFLGGGLLEGLGQGINGWADRNAQREMLNAQLKNQLNLAYINNDAIQRRQQRMFENNMALTGYSSNSAQQGIRNGMGLKVLGPRMGLGYQYGNKDKEDDDDLSSFSSGYDTVASDKDETESTVSDAPSMRTSVAEDLRNALDERKMAKYGPHVDPTIPWDTNNKYQNMLANSGNKKNTFGMLDPKVVKSMTQPVVKSAQLVSNVPPSEVAFGTGEITKAI